MYATQVIILESQITNHSSLKISNKQFKLQIEHSLIAILLFRVQSVVCNNLQSANMSSRLQLKPLLAKSHLPTQHSLISSNSSSHIPTHYQQQLEINLTTILRRYHHLDKSKVRNLLQQLDNNLELAIQIIKEEMESTSQIVEERKEARKALNLTLQQENQVLKQSFLKLYKKLAGLQKHNEQMAIKNEKYRQQIQLVKGMNRMLLEGQYVSRIEESRQIY